MNGDLQLYNVFYTVASLENISKAADALYISQPAVSKSIKKLEDILGMQLFYRSSRGVTLTEEGKIFLEHIKKAMEEITLGEETLLKLKNRELGSVKIGVSSTICKYFLIPHLKSFIGDYPNIKVMINNQTTMDTLKLVNEGKVDFGIVSHNFDYSGYNFIELQDISDVFVTSNNYLKSINIESPNDIFSKGSFMLLEPGNITRDYIDKYFSLNDITIKPELEISNMEFLIEFAKIGMGVTVVVKNFIKDELESGELVEIAVEPKIQKRNIGIVYSKKIPLSIAAQTFIEYLYNNING
ncbi:MAG: LysR family transcriptional regulator [Clostridiaceae bacterium]